jgi:hypothetical protein
MNSIHLILKPFNPAMKLLTMCAWARDLRRRCRRALEIAEHK